MRPDDRQPAPRHPALGHELEVWEGLLRRLRLTWLLGHFPPRLVWAGFVCVNSLLAIAINRLAGIDYPLWSPKKHPSPLPRPSED